MKRIMNEERETMIRRLLSVFISLILMAGFVSGCAAETEKPVITVLRVSEIPAREWQKTAVFPDWKGYTDDTLALNSMISFYGYHGQGQIFLDVSDETESFSLYVNGVKAEPDETGGIFSADISAAAKDGVNTLQISNILPLGLKNAVTAYIPYPEVLPGNGESGGIHPLALKLVEDLIVSDIAFGFPSAQLAVVRNR